MISFQSEPNRSRVRKIGLLQVARQIVNLQSSRRCEPHSKGVSMFSRLMSFGQITAMVRWRSKAPIKSAA
jgi:hypothetical protein